LKQYKKYLNTSDKIRTVLLAYKNKQILNKATAQHRINEILSGIDKPNLIRTNEKLKMERQINRLENELKQMYIERNKRREEASKKLQRFYRGKPAIEITEGERALKGNVREIIATIHKSGKDNPKTLVSKTLAQALKKIPKGQKFKIWAHVERLFDDDSFYHRNTNPFDSDNMAGFIDELDQAFDVQSAGLVSDTGSTITYQCIFPTEWWKTYHVKTREDILNKKSVIKVINNDNNCFWYALAYLNEP
jgi:hypothetical protein